MDISDVIGRSYPQKVTLDSNVVTVTGEIISKGTEIYVLLCDQLLTCTDSINYGNIDITENRVQKTIYLNPRSQEQFLDVHCNGKTYKNVDQLCQDKPRYFSSGNNFFLMDNDEHTVKINTGDEFELTNVHTFDTFVDKGSRERQSHTNVEPKHTSIVRCCCKSSGIAVQILPSTKSSFKCLTDPNPYKPSEILGRFPTPRQVQMCDDEMYRSASKNFGSNQVCIESMTKTTFLLFTLDYEVSTKSQTIQTKDYVKCCQLTDPSFVKLRRRIENKQIGEVFDPTFVFEYEQRGRTIFSVLGKSRLVPISRFYSGRQYYIAMECSGATFSPNPSCDSGFAEAEHDQNVQRPQLSANSLLSHPEGDDDRIDEDDEDYLVPVSCLESGDYVAISVNNERPPPIPERHYRNNDDKELQSDTDTTAIHSTDKGVVQHQTTTGTTEHRVISDSEIGLTQNQTIIETFVMENQKGTDNGTDDIQNQTITDNWTDGIQDQKATDGADNIKNQKATDNKTDNIQNQKATNNETSDIQNQTTTETETDNIQIQASNIITDTIQTETTETSRDKGYKPETKTDDSVKPGEHLRTLSIEKLAELLKTCKLDRFADRCLEEFIDGELFMELTEDILKEDPFKLNKLEILKVNKIKSGWRPNK